MNESERSAQEVEALRERIARLSAAILRISASLDIDTVLREAVESACALTDARYGAITTIDSSGRPQDFVTSGLTLEQQRELVSWPSGPKLFEHLRDFGAPRRFKDLTEYVSTLGIAPGAIPRGAFQTAPMLHRGEQVGCFFLGMKKDRREFTNADEEVLVLFASQAATAIANARAHRDVERSRADLEALVETSPFGVAVINAQTGEFISMNREANRIVASMHIPGYDAQRLVEEVTCRRADGRETTIGQLKNAENVRAEEVELSLPDGRNIRILINATPIRSEDGVIESVVVTLQDLAPLEALERARAEFLGIVSHELRAPLAAIKGSAATALGTTEYLDPAEALQFFRIINEQAGHMDSLLRDLLDSGRIDAGTLSVDPLPMEVGALVERARSTFLSGAFRHRIVIDLPQNLPRVMADERRIVQVLSKSPQQCLPACSGMVSHHRLGGARRRTCRDLGNRQGRGLPLERLAQLFRKHTSIGRDRRSPIGGTGLGLVISKGLVEAHGGRIRAESGGTNHGTRFTFTLPVAEMDLSGAAGAERSGFVSSRFGPDPTPILVIDDDPHMLRYVRSALTAAGYDPSVTGNPHEVPHLIETKKPSLVLLDLMLPGVDGVELMESIPELVDLPVIFISAYGRDETIARALESGAADYLVKPFSPTELTARVRAALRKRIGLEPFLLADLAIDYERRQVSVAGKPVHLTVTEYELLRLLSVNAGRALSYDTLLRQVWGKREQGNAVPVRTFVKKLRRKLGDHATKPVYIVNERGIGYRMPNPGARTESPSSAPPQP